MAAKEKHETGYQYPESNILRCTRFVCQGTAAAACSSPSHYEAISSIHQRFLCSQDHIHDPMEVRDLQKQREVQDQLVIQEILVQLECALSAQNTSLRSTRVSNVLLSYFHTSRPRFDDKYDRNERYECMSMSELLEILSTKPCASFSVDGKRQNQMSYIQEKSSNAFGIRYILFGIRQGYTEYSAFFLFLYTPKNKNKKRKKRGTVFLKKPETRKTGKKDGFGLRTAERGRWRLAASFRGGKWQRERRGAGRWK